MELELMDWKNAERETTEQLRNALIVVETCNIVLIKAKDMIKKLGGKTIAEEKVASGV